MAANTTFLTLDGINFGENNKGNPTAGTVSSYAFDGGRNSDSIHFVMETLGAAPQLINAMNSSKLIARGVLVASDPSRQPTSRNSDIDILTLTFLDSFVSNCVIGSGLAFTLKFSRVLWKNAYVPLPVNETMWFEDSLTINRLKSS